MSRAGDVALAWGDGEYMFRLAYGDLRQLQEKTGVGPQVLWKRLVDGSWLIEDARNVLFFGLVGGGMAPPAATALVKAWCEQRPPAESILPAVTVLAAALFGAPEEPVGKAGAPPAAAEMTGSNSPPSTAPAP